jgi:hypothetical protein
MSTASWAWAGLKAASAAAKIIQFSFGIVLSTGRLQPVAFCTPERGKSAIAHPRSQARWRWQSVAR